MLETVAKPVSNLISPSNILGVASDSPVAVGSHNLQQQQLVARKRSAQALGTDADSIKKRNISLRYIRIKQIRENHMDHVAEIFFLQTNSNMMDFPTWRQKKGNNPEYSNFAKKYRLEPNSTVADATQLAGVTTVAPTTQLNAVTATPAVQTIGQSQQQQHQHHQQQQSHTHNITQTQPPPLISTNSPHGKKNMLCKTNICTHIFIIIHFHFSIISMGINRCLVFKTTPICLFTSPPPVF